MSHFILFMHSNGSAVPLHIDLNTVFMSFINIFIPLQKRKADLYLEEEVL